MDLFKKNLDILAKYQPGLARRIEKTPYPEDLTLVKSKTGHLSPKIQNITLHSLYNPTEEASRLIEKFNPTEKCLNTVYGLGFGYHILELLKRTKGEILVIEPFVPVFRAFLSHFEIDNFLPRVIFSIGESAAKITNQHSKNQWKILYHQPSVRLSKKYFNVLDQCLKTCRLLEQSRLKVMVINPIYGGSLPTALYCASAFKNLGHEVCSVNCEDFVDSFNAIKEMTKVKKNAQILSNRFFEMMSDIILSKAAEFKPDFILAMAQAPLQPATISRLKTLRVPVAFWFVEDFRTLTYWKEIVKSYDYFFTIQRGDFFDELKKMGIRNYYYLPQACSPENHQPVKLLPDEIKKYSVDLSFMGAAYFNRQNVFPRLLDFDFKVWGTGWPLETPISTRLQNNNERVSTVDSVKIYNATKINLNLHSSTCHNEINPNGDFVNPRTFEIAACGGFQLVDERSELFEIFDVGLDIIKFKSIDELKKLIRYYLDHESDRKQIAENARAKVLEYHTFEIRLNEMLIFVFHDKQWEIENRIKNRSSQWQLLMDQAGSNTELGKYIDCFKGEEKVLLKDLVKEIEQQDGKLSPNELLILMADQVVKEAIH